MKFNQVYKQLSESISDQPIFIHDIVTGAGHDKWVQIRNMKLLSDATAEVILTDDTNVVVNLKGKNPNFRFISNDGKLIDAMTVASIYGLLQPDRIFREDRTSKGYSYDHSKIERLKKRVLALSNYGLPYDDPQITKLQAEIRRLEQPIRSEQPEFKKESTLQEDNEHYEKGSAVPKKWIRLDGQTWKGPYGFEISLEKMGHKLFGQSFHTYNLYRFGKRVDSFNKFDAALDYVNKLSSLSNLTEDNGDGGGGGDMGGGDGSFGDMGGGDSGGSHGNCDGGDWHGTHGMGFGYGMPVYLMRSQVLDHKPKKKRVEVSKRQPYKKKSKKKKKQLDEAWMDDGHWKWENKLPSTKQRRIEAMQKRAMTTICPRCGSTDVSQRHHNSFAFGEVYFDYCNECEHQWNHG